MLAVSLTQVPGLTVVAEALRKVAVSQLLEKVNPLVLVSPESEVVVSVSWPYSVRLAGVVQCRVGWVG